MVHRRSLEKEKLREERRRAIRDHSLWEPLEKETVAYVSFNLPPQYESHQSGEVLYDKKRAGSLQLAPEDVEQRLTFLHGLAAARRE